jgi:hypothetical protein
MEVRMSRNPSLTRKVGSLGAGLTSIKQRVATLAAELVNDKQGLGKQAYFQLCCLMAELGEMPEMPEVYLTESRYYRKEQDD